MQEVNEMLPFEKDIFVALITKEYKKREQEKQNNAPTRSPATKQRPRAPRAG